MPGIKRKILENNTKSKVLLKKKFTEDFFVKHFCWNADDDFIQKLQTQSCLTKKENVNISEFNNYDCSAIWRTSEKVFIIIKKLIKLIKFFLISLILMVLNLFHTANLMFR